MKKLFLLMLLIVFTHFVTNAADIPKLIRTNNGSVNLILNGKPFLILGGELMNSSASTLENMAPKWKTIKQLNVNTVLLPITWEQFEPEEGTFDYSVTEGLIKQAREYDMKLIFLWFGSWKNATSGYAPHWVMRDTKRFPRMQTAKGENRPYLSNLSEELNNADAKAFKALMTFIKKIDSKEQTVIMCQIENEVGIKGDSRDRSVKAEKLFASDVPAELMNYITEKEKQLLPEIVTRWNENGKKTKGSWAEVFGKNDLADELFMAWHYAKFIDKIAVAGKEVYPLPMFVNAWTINPEKPIPGVYPSGGPNHRMLDVWQAAALSIDFIGVDNYLEDYKDMCKQFYRNGNPMFVPEAVPLWLGDKLSGPAKAFYTFGEFNTLCFSPFAIDHPAYDENHPLGRAYHVLNYLTPLIIQEQETGNMRGFMEQDSKNERIDFKDYYLNINYDKPYLGYGLVIRLADDEFLIAGNGFSAQFFSKMKPLSGLSYGTIREGYYENGKWKTTKYLNGDEAGQGVGGFKLPGVYLKEDANINTITSIRIKLVPIDGSTTENTEDLN
jgi:hypothetical protein